MPSPIPVQVEDFTSEEVIRFTDRFLVGEGCWPWQSKTKHPGGYGHFRIRGRNPGAHRVSYQLFVGPIPEGLELDHLCRNRACVRPDHLEPVTTRENVLRGEGPTALHSRKTHCINGHPFNEKNTYVFRGGRWCRACRPAYRRALKARKLAKENA